tara:strand:+ start:113 stop:607 length:495 start_codon:yes stop_codon:yes gene_type:complete
MDIFTFTKNEIANWEIENDTVMGGESTSQIKHIVKNDEDTMVFTGKVSLENNGGFAQTQYQFDNTLDLSDFSQVVIRGNGDGKTYKIRFETSANNVAYQASFGASDNFAKSISFDELEKIHHGEPAPDKPDFDASDIQVIGILIGNNKAEEFEITLHSIIASSK